jgi:hypothetical protein
VPKNFDEVHPEDRSFILGGETFHWQPLGWREWGDLIDEEVVHQAEDTREAEAHEKAVDEALEKGETLPPMPTGQRLTTTMERVIDRIIRYLVAEDVERFKAVVNDPGRKISALQLREMRDWLQEVTNNRPTEQPSPSDAGRGNTAPSLRVASS